MAPIARDAAGLPIGAQVMGPYLGDRTTIALAGEIAALKDRSPRRDPSSG